LNSNSFILKICGFNSYHLIVSIGKLSYSIESKCVKFDSINAKLSLINNTQSKYVSQKILA